MTDNRKRRPNHLAWHETLEIHELVNMQATATMKMKKFIPQVKDRQLRDIYQRAVRTMERHLEELLKFYNMAPREGTEESEYRQAGDDFYAAEFLSFSKASVKSYAGAITEAATPVVRDTLTNHLHDCIKAHGEIFEYMYDKGLYPAYDLQKMLHNDMKNARNALEMRTEE
ncbi:spore coat protein [Virgibacillus sp. 179-BFC.A HS]|uniref:Spore coat protein n=1 Tax=Tigheibacillus jepli TaxID=3035914 RepID=A0ABU5CGE5_9BACI|nr:spore coat protein [Virgibacillus sp. 179-BFC.A HS]MDY0405384.1 spore coat protein [Virgibacillus sp. 179-BFC.A HS]